MLEMGLLGYVVIGIIVLGLAGTFVLIGRHQWPRDRDRRD